MAEDALKALIDDLSEVPQAVRKDLRRALIEAAQPVKSEVQRRASWSTRIPAATRIRVSFSRSNPTVEIVVDSRLAPHARPLENRGREGKFRTPLFGNREHWFDHEARPFVVPAWNATREQAFQRIARSVDTTLRAHRFR